MELPPILVPKATVHLHPFLSELPKNCLFNKAVAGCGGTSVALFNDQPTIVCVPYVAMIDNKVTQSIDDKEKYPYPIFGFYSNDNELGVEMFLYGLKPGSIPKIMVTYDSLERLMNYDVIDPLEYTLLVDEYHCLFTEYRFRNKAVRSVLRNFRRFKSYTFMTATPVDPNYLLNELADIPVCNAQWEDQKPLYVDQRVCNISMKDAVSSHVRAILIRPITGNHYLFVNSVQFIESIIKSCGLTNDDTRVICSDSNKGKLSIDRSKPSSPPKKINFVTKTAFEGVDYYDPIGKISVISDAHQQHSLIDISTQLQQIAGRIRNSKYIGKIHHVYSTTKLSESKSMETFVSEQTKKCTTETVQASVINSMENGEAKLGLSNVVDWQFHYVDQATGDVVRDTNYDKFDLWAFTLLHVIYKSAESVGAEYKKYHIEGFNAKYQMPNLELFTQKMAGFEKVVTELERLRLSNTDKVDHGSLYSGFLMEVTSRFPFLPDAIRLLGFDGIKQKQYHVGSIKKYLASRTPKAEDRVQLLQVQQLLQLNSKFIVGATLGVNYIKRILQDCYQQAGISAKPKTKDLRRYFTLTEKSQPLDFEGKQQQCHKIIAIKDLV